MMAGKRTVGQQIAYSFAFLTLMLVVVGVFGVLKTRQVNDMLNAMYTDNLIPIVNLSEANQHALKHEGALQGRLREADAANVGEWSRSLEAAQKNVEENLKAYSSAFMTDEEKATLARLLPSWKKYLDLSQQAVEQANRGDHERARTIADGVLAVSFNEAQAELEKLISLNQAYGKKAYDDSDVVYANAFRLAIMLIVLVTGASLALGVFITRGISGSLTRVGERLTEASRQVRAGSEQLSSAAQQLSSGTSEQAGSIEETSSSLEEMNGMVAANLENAAEAARLTAEVARISEQGNASMEKLQGSMQAILQSTQRIQDLVRVIAEIGEKTRVMDEIVFQTKLLSFNASVEAERAGEHGRGFAVVAQEVGNLAQMSGVAAQEISRIVSASIRSAEEITADNRKRVEEGDVFARETAGILRDVLQAARTVSSAAEQVVTASKEQGLGIKQIGVAMNTVEQATQENAALAEEVASTSEELAAQTEALNLSVAELERLVRGDGRADRGMVSEPVVQPSAQVVALPVKGTRPLRRAS